MNLRAGQTIVSSRGTRTKIHKVDHNYVWISNDKSKGIEKRDREILEKVIKHPAASGLTFTIEEPKVFEGDLFKI